MLFVEVPQTNKLKALKAFAITNWHRFAKVCPREESFLRGAVLDLLLPWDFTPKQEHLKGNFQFETSRSDTNPETKPSAWCNATWWWTFIWALVQLFSLLLYFPQLKLSDMLPYVASQSQYKCVSYFLVLSCANRFKTVFRHAWMYYIHGKSSKLADWR